MAAGTPSRRIRFGVFEIDLQTGELRKSGVRISLQDQPVKVLAILLERAGDLVSRDELKQRLWADSEFGDFDQAINIAIKKIRTALGDSSDNPRFIETLSRRGYRFIAPVTVENSVPAEQPQASRLVVIPTAWRKWTFVGALIAAVLVLAAFIVLRRPHEYSLGVFTRRADVRLIPLTSSLGYEMDPRFSPDGKQIAYAWSAGGKDQPPPDIYVKVLGAGSPVRLMPPQPNVARVLPAWSPDGRFIACLRIARRPPPVVDEKESQAEQKLSVAERMMKQSEEVPPDMAVYVIPAVGGEERKLFAVSKVTDLVWWPDGKGFLIAMRENISTPVSLYHYSLDGTQRQRLTNPPATLAGDTIPAFSPDGQLIAFSRNWSSGGSDVFVVPASGGEPRRVTQDAHHLRGLTFTPDGREIIYSSPRLAGERRSLWRVSVNGGTPIRLPFGTDYADAPEVARHGNRLAFVQGHDSEQIWAYNISMGAETAEPPKILIGSRQMQVGPQYSPEGKRIVFASDRTGSWELWICQADGTHPVQLTSFGDRQTGTPRWSADGKWIVFDARPERHSEIYVIDSEGGQPRRLTFSDVHDSVVASFSRDGKWIYYSSNASGNWELWKTAMDGRSQPIQVTHQGGFSAFESSDGKTLYYSKWDKPGIFSRPVEGGTESLVTVELLPKLWGAWSLAENGIFIVIPAQDADKNEFHPELAFFDFSTKSMRHLHALDGTPHPGPILAAAPDGKTVLIAQPDPGGSDIMIVENFH